MISRKALGFILGAMMICGAAYGQEAGQSMFKAPGQVDNIHKTGDLGIGIFGGAPSGIDAKLWINEAAAIRPELGFINGNAGISADYLYHFRGAGEELTGSASYNQVAPYIGAGLTTAFGTGNNYFNHDITGFGLGVRIPLGVEWLPPNVPAGVFAEIMPGFGFVPNAYGFFQGDVGGRYYF